MLSFLDYDEGKLKKYLFGQAREIFVECIHECIKDPILNLREPGTSCINLANEILGSKERQDEMFSLSIFQHFHEIMSKSSVKCHEREKMFHNLHNFFLSDNLYSNWELFLKKCSITAMDVSMLLLQVIADMMLLKFIKLRNTFLEENDKSGITDEHGEIQLTPMEEKTLRYVSGYIPYSLKKKFTGMKESLTKDAAISVIDSWNEESSGCNNSENTFLSYTTEWVEKVNRGGLFKVNDDFYIFIRNVELCARKILNITLMKRYGGESIQLLLLHHLNSNTWVDKSWNSITNRVENVELKTKIKDQIFKKWINIRGNAFVKAWVDKIKLRIIMQKSKKNKDKHEKIVQLDKKATPSLRKTLHK